MLTGSRKSITTYRDYASLVLPTVFACCVGAAACIVRMRGQLCPAGSSLHGPRTCAMIALLSSVEFVTAGIYI
jgi:hypothetical protein